MAAASPLFSAPIGRVLACTLGVLITSTLITAGSATYLPLNEIDRIGVPILLFPVTWTALFLLAAMTPKLWRVWVGLSVLTLLHAGLIYQHLAG